MRLFVMGHRGPLRLSDICKLYNESVLTLCSVFEHEWEKQQNYNERSDLEEDSGRESLLVSSKTNTGPLTLRWVILFCERQAVFNWAGYTHSLQVFGAVCCCAVSQHQFEKHSRIITANAQTVLAGALYRNRTQLIIREGSEQLIKEMLHKYQVFCIPNPHT
ncbi:putative ATP-binding cassette sub-family C member 13 [Sinocyclocheilus anshuiensis]|uniref:putative ATP-binding cassette sub-family C member 13 n=1 Tax=Sinocyclocheilus anshuiensis TaxID=1608454 RepID=UPI0007B9AD39|nr:PREDICTED: putative ATP-binding cassette sub-family C member 13 [Sinocyclocheilus anshuiensis]